MVDEVALVQIPLPAHRFPESIIPTLLIHLATTLNNISNCLPR